MNGTGSDLDIVRLADYAPPDFVVDSVSLTFDLDPASTRVTSELTVRRNPKSDKANIPLTLDGEGLLLEGLWIDGRALNDTEFGVEANSLTISDLPDAFLLKTVTVICPAENKALEGLYLSGGRFCTQCEAEGFRRITYFPDRPDVLSRYRVEIRALKKDFPVLLSNGNRVSAGMLENGRHYAIWEDPFPKPCYLFALVAGDLAHLTRSYKTATGKEVSLSLFVEHGKETRGTFALEALERAMAWDENVYGLEYDLDVYNIVAVSDFNMGAMENKSLNIFNDKYILATPQTATDDDYEWIEAIVAHEYFHNWTGNRVTCRDWFQLSLKEGLTVFREQQFSADMRSPSVKRIKDVSHLRATQFPEDAGPLAHPVRPPSYAEISNFYTHTVYEKGAEVVRMIHTLIGPEAFKAGMKLYFERHDGQAVTCEDFVRAMSDASGTSLEQFFWWYERAGTPAITVSREYNVSERTYKLTISQQSPNASAIGEGSPFVIPLRLGFVENNLGALKTATHESSNELKDSHLLFISRRNETYSFHGFPEGAKRPVATLNHGFAAPVIIHNDLTLEDLKVTCVHGIDSFVRWDCLQEIMLRTVLNSIKGHDTDDSCDALRECISGVIDRSYEDPAEVALMMSLPSDAIIESRFEIIDPEAIFRARMWLQNWIVDAFRERLDGLFNDFLSHEPYSPEGKQVGRRDLCNTALAFLVHAEDGSGRQAAHEHYFRANNLTDRWAALRALNPFNCREREEVMTDFHDRSYDESLVLDKWFSLEAECPRTDAIEHVKKLMEHKKFDASNPNRIRATLGAFAARNPIGFHKQDGSGYKFLTSQILRIDSFNPQVAARLAASFQRWRRYGDERRSLMKSELETIRDHAGTSKDVAEIVTKSLEEPAH
jgi:aminopeptidase N